MLQRLFALLSDDGVVAPLVRPLAGNGLVRIVGIVASFTVGVQLARGLGATNYGYYSIALAVITLAGIPSEFGLPMLVTRDVAAASVQDDRSELFVIIRWAERSCRWIALAIMAFVIAAILLLRHLYSWTITECVLAGAPVIPLLALSRVRTGAVQGLGGLIGAQIPEGLVRPLFYSCVLAVAYLAGVRFSAPFAMALYSATMAVVLVVSSFWLRRTLPGKPVQPRTGRKRSIANTLHLGLMDGIRVIQGELSIVLAGLVAAPAVVGLLRIANVTAMTAAVPLVIMVQVGNPLMAKLHASGDHERLQKTVTALSQVQFAGVVLLSLPLLAFPGALLKLVFGSPFEAAAEPLRVLVLTQLVNAAFGPNIALLAMAHRERRAVVALAIGLVVAAIAVPILTSFGGAVGASFGLLAAMLCWNVMSWHDARRLLHVDTFFIRLSGLKDGAIGARN